VHDYQSLIFRSASHWSEATSLVVLATGLLCTLQGFRFARFLIPIACLGGGLVAGALAVALLGLPPLVALISAAAFGIAGIARYRIGLTFASAFTFAALAQYLAVQCGMKPNMSLFAAGVGLIGGFALVWACRRVLPIFVTILQGGGLLVVGFVGITSALVPTLGLTFVEWSERIPLMVPALILMLCILGYSVQANAVQGDMETGGDPGLNDLEAS
jgi:hypothetical protein